jgi:1-phosphatidylinositol phosphodiesterase
MNLLPPTDTQPPCLPITYFSAANFPLALPSIVAKGFGWPAWGLGVYGINTLLGKWLLERMGESTVSNLGGWTLMDYCDEPGETQVVPLLVECNFLGRRDGC